MEWHRRRGLTAVEESSRAKVSGSFVEVPVWGGSSRDGERTAHRYTIKRYGRQSGPVRDAYPTIIFREHKLPNLFFPAVVIWQRFAAGADARALNRRYPLNRRPKR